MFPHIYDTHILVLMFESTIENLCELLGHIGVEQGNPKSNLVV